MSLNIEDSPLSDNKMDISETTTSQESAAEFSPEHENRENFGSSINRNNSTGTISKKSNDSSSSKVEDINCTTKTNNVNSSTETVTSTLTTTISTTTTATTTTKTSTNTITLQQQNEYVDKYLENCTNSKVSNSDIEGNTESLNVLSSSKNGLTPVKSHPLMSMGISGSDSESESSRKKVDRFSKFPDVVPESEPLRLGGNPYANRDENDEFFTSQKQYKINTKSSLDFVSDLDNLNINNNVSASNKKKQTIEVLRELESPDMHSSGDSEDLSQFQATVEPIYQTVALQHSSSRCQLSPQPPQLVHQRKKIPLSSDLMYDNISDTISNHSLDMDDENPYLASLSPSSSIFDDTAFREIQTPTTPATPSIEPLPQYSASDEARDSRNWQKITLPDGKTREIDMKVIDPYKRVLSHGGYLKSGGHNAIVVFSACHLPDRSRADYHYVMNNLFLYVVKTLEQLVTEDYVLVYLHGGSNRGNVPPFPWLKKCYQLLDRRLRKSLKYLYMVHPTFWLKSVVWMSRPFISSKFWRKLIYVRTLEELYKLVPVEKAAVPDKVKNYDSKYT